MAFGDLNIEIIIKEKDVVIWQESSITNNDILDMEKSWMMFLEKRISDLWFKISNKINNNRIKPWKKQK